MQNAELEAEQFCILHSAFSSTPPVQQQANNKQRSSNKQQPHLHLNIVVKHPVRESDRQDDHPGDLQDPPERRRHRPSSTAIVTTLSPRSVWSTTPLIPSITRP